MFLTNFSVAYPLLAAGALEFWWGLHACMHAITVLHLPEASHY
jgi:hypothetical protein